MMFGGAKLLMIPISILQNLFKIIHFGNKFEINTMLCNYYVMTSFK